MDEATKKEKCNITSTGKGFNGGGKETGGKRMKIGWEENQVIKEHKKTKVESSVPLPLKPRSNAKEEPATYQKKKGFKSEGKRKAPECKNNKSGPGLFVRGGEMANKGAAGGCVRRVWDRGYRREEKEDIKSITSWNYYSRKRRH